MQWQGRRRWAVTEGASGRGSVRSSYRGSVRSSYRGRLRGSHEGRAGGQLLRDGGEEDFDHAILRLAGAPQVGGY